MYLIGYLKAKADLTMAYDEFLEERITQFLITRIRNFETKKMMGGLAYMVNDSMLCGILIDKKTKQSLLMNRIGEEAYVSEIKKPACRPMDFTGRPMKGYIFVTPDGFDLDEDLAYWIDLALDFNAQLTT
ncbi:MAG: hypothetical protein ACJAZM_001282 [Cyclobacteriaceae bacterium]